MNREDWGRRAGYWLFIVFTTEVGLILAFFPWTPNWTMNLVPMRLRIPPEIWLNGYLRGAVTGIGLANVWVAVNDFFRRRPALQDPPSRPAATPSANR